MNNKFDDYVLGLATIVIFLMLVLLLVLIIKSLYEALGVLLALFVVVGVIFSVPLVISVGRWVHTTMDEGGERR